MPRYGSAGARTLPVAVFTSRMSPRSTPIFAAVSGCSSTHELQRILVTGSGSSCSHGLFAPRPSPTTGDGYTTSLYSPAVPDAVAGVAAGAGAAPTARAATEPGISPRAYAPPSVAPSCAPGRRDTIH